ncbi:MAG TPA: 16S rRNA (guanine(966)-N(2))-methyltransferase RsmD [Defluviitaleaceae bacterium]|nr:16S rRNA (guanine(966)-N(2))-methyltransferase RsmD [Defluviitaleaceae bacterium]HPT76147.1 16S rRNA (guanine(966)-N(2))-methyltransferase RsmD [Defluviitaleaceae bacterium]HQD50070.1 16S rRNA (guanine(966)-N(2))-methyltransferase RsmD [Defluviitaleaceae bacterium]
MIAGVAKGHKLKAPKGMDTRPTTDKIKESLFNIIAPDLYDCNFLDLYSGTGAIGIEALSRGAKKAVFIDRSRICRKIIEDNLNHTKLIDKAVIYQNDVNKGLDILKEKGEIFDIIFMDPPYLDNDIEKILEKISKLNLITPSGYIIVEHSSEKRIQAIADLWIWKEKIFKTTRMTFLKVVEESL